ncbi:nuclease-related domain-containing protein [Actinomadura rudentiformis]|uniref:NERD domain-containing protein n=1 Tax=Actinomadura rudentiformis TaxID=359158 RepID=A0A6H9Z4G1_9ACTN|nr:nuclease-related domain-containing protein [Actinomadura rudentiformis]KAB2350831.1 NERD domain-containing protein [Actinomadura rudentiformis]
MGSPGRLEEKGRSVRIIGVGTSNAGASAWSRYRMLVAEHRQERLLLRGVLACGIGVVVAGFSVWWAGPGTAMAAFAAFTVYERTRPSPATSWRQGAVAERRTGRSLARLDPSGFKVLHDRALPGAPATNLDHLVIGITGVYAIASRRWRWGLRLRSEGRRLWVGNKPAGDLAGAATRAARTVAEVLSLELDHEVPVTPMVSVHGAKVPRSGLRHGGVLFVAARPLPDVLSARPVVFTSAQVATVTAAAEQMLPPMLETLFRK